MRNLILIMTFLVFVFASLTSAKKGGNSEKSARPDKSPRAVAEPQNERLEKEKYLKARQRKKNAAKAARQKNQDIEKQKTEKSKKAEKAKQAEQNAETGGVKIKSEKPQTIKFEHQSKKVQEKISSETDKHTKRAARLERMRELAVEAGDEKKIARIDKLIDRENNRYEKKIARLEQKQTMFEQLSDQGKGKKVKDKTKEKADGSEADEYEAKDIEDKIDKDEPND